MFTNQKNFYSLNPDCIIISGKIKSFFFLLFKGELLKLVSFPKIIFINLLLLKIEIICLISNKNNTN